MNFILIKKIPDYIPIYVKLGKFEIGDKFHFNLNHTFYKVDLDYLINKEYIVEISKYRDNIINEILNG